MLAAEPLCYWFTSYWELLKLFCRGAEWKVHKAASLKYIFFAPQETARKLELDWFCSLTVHVAYLERQRFCSSDSWLLFSSDLWALDRKYTQWFGSLIWFIDSHHLSIQQDGDRHGGVAVAREAGYLLLKRLVVWFQAAPICTPRYQSQSCPWCIHQSAIVCLNVKKNSDAAHMSETGCVWWCYIRTSPFVM